MRVLSVNFLLDDGGRPTDIKIALERAATDEMHRLVILPLKLRRATVSTPQPESAKHRTDLIVQSCPSVSINVGNDHLAEILKDVVEVHAFGLQFGRERGVLSVFRDDW